MYDERPTADDSDPTEQNVDTDTEPTTVRHDWERSGEPSVTVIEAVATATDRTVTDLPPLQQSIDPDGLDALLTHGHSSVTVTFTYADVTVTVSGNGTVEIPVDSPPTREGDSETEFLE